MERAQGTITFDLTLAAIIVLMMATTAQDILFWYNHVRDHQDTLSELSLHSLSAYLVRKLVYFSVLWWLFLKTATITLFRPGEGDSTGYL